MKLSIITICYNNAIDLAKTIDSVLGQSWQDFEYIIIDGGSTDGSVEVIERNVKRLSYWVSEPDGGVFNAMNKGIAKAGGEYLLMLNAGDYLCNDGVLEQVFGAGLYTEDLLIGDVYREADGKIFAESHFPDVYSFDFFRKGSLSHQGTFIRRSLHDLLGMYDESLRFSADWKFFLLGICKFNVSYRHLPFFISVCDCGGLTCSAANFSDMREESDRVLQQEFPAFLADYAELEALKAGTLKNRVLTLGKRIRSLKNRYAAKL